MNFRSKLALSTAIAVGVTTLPAWAQTEEIVVTARKVEERLLDTPIAIAAITGAELTARGILNLQDLAQNIPGTNVVNQAFNGSRSDRSGQVVVMRGIAPSSSTGQTSSLFIDGVPVATAAAIQTIVSPERVEVLKGPQSAYFGRQTFAGAINVVNQMPGDSFSGKVSGLVGTRSNYEATLEVAGPLVGDKLGFRAAAKAYGKHGSYANAADPNATLGNQSTQFGSLLLVARPSDSLTVKAFGMVTDKNDGAPAQGVISTFELRDASGALALVNQSNCFVGNRNPFFCGTLPTITNLTPAQTPTISPAALTSYLDPNGRAINPKDGPQGLGLASRDVHIHVAADWQIGNTGFTVSSLSGYNKGRWGELADVDNIASTNFAPFNTTGGFNADFFLDSKYQDVSQELRASFENGGRFHATFGGSYLAVRTRGSSGGNGGNPVSPITKTLGGRSGSNTAGAFFGLGYDVTSQVTFNFDGRYQVDRIMSFAGPAGVTVSNATVGIPLGRYAPESKVFEGTYKNFMPRVIGRYKWDTDNMVYASFSKGINPGLFNTGLLTLPVQGAVIAVANNLGLVVRPERLTNYEIGAKGLLFDRKLRYDLSAYYAIWDDQVNTQAYFYTNALGQPANFVVSTNTGKEKVKGFEANLGYSITEGLTLDVGLALTDNIVEHAFNATTTALTGLTDFSGKRGPLAAKWSGTAALQYVAPVIPEKDIDGLIRIDASFKSSSYTDFANNVKSPTASNVNLTVGVQTTKWTFQGYVSNVFNNRGYYSAINSVVQDASAAHLAVQSSVVVQLRELRTFGLKASLKF